MLSRTLAITILANSVSVTEYPTDGTLPSVRDYHGVRTLVLNDPLNRAEVLSHDDTKLTLDLREHASVNEVGEVTHR